MKLVITVMFLVLLQGSSCHKIREYFREPDTGCLTETIQTSVVVGYAADIAMAEMQGVNLPGVTMTRSNPGFPCTAMIYTGLTRSHHPLINQSRYDDITIAGIWTDESTAILTLLFTRYHSGNAVLDILGIKTIPVIRNDSSIMVALASMDIKLNPDSESLLSMNLGTLEIESELLRLEMQPPGDVYVAVNEDAYLVEINTGHTGSNLNDDSFKITGGGQLIEASGSSAEIVQQAMIDLVVSPGCILNPLQGMALIKVTGVEDEGFPELGTALLECDGDCNGSARVFAATGMYVTTNGKKVDLPVQ
jgi:hypothetical protein